MGARDAPDLLERERSQRLGVGPTGRRGARPASRRGCSAGGRAESVLGWRQGLEHAGLEHAIDSSDLMAEPSPNGVHCRRIYFNVVASRWPLQRLPGPRLNFPERYLAATVGRVT